MSDSSEQKKSGLTDWDSVDSRRNKKGTNFLRLKSGETYTIRLFHKPKEIYRYYVNGKSAICGDPDNCPVAIKHNEKPKLRYAINVIDRNGGEVKVMEAPAMVFREFKKFYEANQIDPGGNDAPDFVIKVEGTGLNTKYHVANKMQPKPFTTEEKTLLKASRYDLDELFKPTPADEIEAKLYGGDDAGNGGEKPQTPPAGNGGGKSGGEFDW